MMHQDHGMWMQEARESIERRGTAGVCSGKRFGGPTCPEGSKRHALAVTFRKIAKRRRGMNSGSAGHSGMSM